MKTILSNNQANVLNLLASEKIITDNFYLSGGTALTEFYKSLNVDGILDIAVNKLFTIYQKPRSRDFIDLYLIIQKQGLSLEELIKKARIKFDWYIDPIQLGAQFLQSQKVADYPNMIVDLGYEEVKEFFVCKAKELGREILE